MPRPSRRRDVFAKRRIIAAPFNVTTSVTLTVVLITNDCLTAAHFAIAVIMTRKSGVGSVIEDQELKVSRPMDSSVAATPIKSPKVISHPIWDLITKVAAPLTIAIAAACYVSGFAYRGFLLPSFGLSASSIDPSVQATVASGYVAVWSSIFRHFWASLITLVLWIAFWMSWRVPTENRFIKAFDFVSGGTQAGAGILLALVGGLAAGETAATRDIEKVNTALHTECRTSCRHYMVARGSFYGVTIAGDKDRLFVATRSGLRIVKMEDIRRIESGGYKSYTDAAVTTLL